jgi:amino acid adenylation domain-containing protein
MSLLPDVEASIGLGECVASTFADIALKHGDAIALLSASEPAWSYSKLDQFSNGIAHLLLKAGVSPQDRVGVCVERSCSAIAALLGVLKAGAIYVPFDPSHPTSRLQWMAEDADVACILVDEIGAKRTAELPLGIVSLSIPEALNGFYPAPHVSVGENDLAYLMYTSGSTGTPKAVAIEHRGILRLVRDPDYVTLTPQQRILQLAPLSFDASTFEIWGALLNGASLVIAPQSTCLKQLADLIVDWRVDTMWLTSGYFNVLVREHPEALRNLKQLLAGGDVLSPRHVNEALLHMPEGQVINGYGPTENTTFTSCHRITLDDTCKSAIPIGKPINGTQVYLLDEKLRPVKANEAGEIFIGGKGLAREYWRRPELTERSFIEVELKPGHKERLYRSGDLGRWNESGCLEFLGRIDGQLKIRGFRIEPEEIERALEELPSLAAAAVVGKGKTADEKHLCCFYVTNSVPVTPAEIKAFLASRLPEHLVPAEYGELDILPLTLNGKLDREALRNCSAATTGADVEFADEIEVELAGLWKEILGIPAIGPNDDFFQFGGHSLAAARLFSKIEKKFGKQLPLVTAMQAPTIRQMAALLRNSTQAHEQQPTLVCLSDRPGRRPFFTIHAIDGNILGYRKIAMGLKEFSVYDVRLAIDEDTTVPPVSVEEHAARAVRMIREQQPEGPYCLGGYSAYGVLAFEVARQLRLAGHDIGALVLFDSHIGGNFSSLLRQHRYLAASACFTRTAVWNLRCARKAGFWRYVSHRVPGLAPLMRWSEEKMEKGEDCGHVSHSLLLAISAYRPTSFDCGAILIKTPESDQYNSRQALAWSRLLRAGVEVHYISGSHETLFKEPHLSMLVEKLNGSLVQTISIRAA